MSRRGFVATDAVTMTVVFAGLVGAIAWNVITWYFGLPSSSSHALIGGLVGAVAAASGFGAVNGDGLISDLIVYGLVRSNDMRREHRSLAAAGFALLGVVAVLLTAALVVFGLILLARKS